MNSKNASLGAEIVEKTVEELTSTLRKQQQYQFKLLVRFVSELLNANVVQASSVVDFFHKLLDTNEEEGVPKRRKDFFVSVVLSALPFVNNSKITPFFFSPLNI